MHQLTSFPSTGWKLSTVAGFFVSIFLIAGSISTYAQTTGVPIPNIGNNNNSNIDTEKMIQTLMKPDQTHLTELQDQLTKEQNEKAAWQQIGTLLSNVKDSANTLYSFQNPFEDRSVTSTNDSVLTASADRTASESTSSIVVKKVASRDRFLSNSVDDSFEVPAGHYTLGSGSKQFTFDFNGGSLSDLAAAINKRAQGTVNAKVIRNTTSSSVLMLEAEKAGASNALTFGGDTIPLATKIGLLKPADEATRILSLNLAAVRRWEKPLTSDNVSVENGGLFFPPGAEASIPFTPQVKTKENLVLEIDLTVKNLPYNYTPPVAPPGPSTPKSGGVTLQDVQVQNQPSRVVAPEWNPPKPPVKRDDLNVLFISGDNKITALPPIQGTDGKQTIKVPINNYVDVLSAVNVRNNNTYRNITITGIRTYNPNTRGGYTPLNPVETAGDADITLDGVDVTRPTNTISDLIPGVTLHLQSASTTPVTLDVAPDTKAAKDAILKFVFDYDKLLTEINILTSRDQKVIDEVTYFTSDQKKTAQDQLGMLQGDITLMELKSRLQDILMNPYPTTAGSSLTLLDQIGISTNASTNGGSVVDQSKLRGYLEVDDTKLDAALKNHFDVVKQLFGRDTNGDLVIDNGVAYTLYTYTTPYVGPVGFLTFKSNNIDTEIKQTNTDIANYKTKMATDEANYRTKFGQMQASLDELEQNSNQLTNFTNSQKNNGQ